MRLKTEDLVRSYKEVGSGDFVQVKDGWKRIAEEPETESRIPNEWKITTEDRCVYNGWRVLRYAKAEDLTE
jgi:hypothetical protein